MKRTCLLLVTAVLILSVLLTACGSMEKNSYEGLMYEDSGYYTETEAAASLDSASDPLAVQDGRKLITTISMTVQTENFQTYLTTLEAAVTQFHGYVESSEVSGSERHHAYYTVRIPSKDTDKFLDSLSQEGTVASKSTSMEDVTLQYNDTESHLKALRTEEESLLRLLESATSVEEIIYVQDRLTEVRYEIESYESRIRLYDNMIDYATISFSVDEVLHVQPVMEETAGTWDQIGHNLKENTFAVGNFFRMVFIDLISILPFLLILGLITFIVLFFSLILPRRRRKKAQKTDNK